MSNHWDNEAQRQQDHENHIVLNGGLGSTEYWDARFKAQNAQSQSELNQELTNKPTDFTGGSNSFKPGSNGYVGYSSTSGLGIRINKHLMHWVLIAALSILCGYVYQTKHSINPDYHIGDQILLSPDTGIATLRKNFTEENLSKQAKFVVSNFANHYKEVFKANTPFSEMILCKNVPECINLTPANLARLKQYAKNTDSYISDLCSEHYKNSSNVPYPVAGNWQLQKYKYNAATWSCVLTNKAEVVAAFKKQNSTEQIFAYGLGLLVLTILSFLKISRIRKTKSPEKASDE